MNNVYEYGGIADVLLRSKIEKEIGGVHYAANEPYTFLKDVTIQFQYEQTNAQNSGRKPIFAANNGRPFQLVINGVPLTQKIANLVLTNDRNTTYKRTRRERIVCNENGELNLCYESVGEIFVYNANMERVLDNFTPHEEYLVFYQQEIAYGDKYSFEVPLYPYFELDVFMKGNTNKIANDIYMHFDAASLASVPNFNIVSGGILNTPLVFNLIYVNQEEPIIVFEN